MTERRRSTRSRCLVGALVTFNNAKSSLSCVARNITADGCMLVFGEDPLIPSRINIQLSNRKDIVPADVAWRDGKNVGVAFRAAQG